MDFDRKKSIISNRSNLSRVSKPNQKSKLSFQEESDNEYTDDENQDQTEENLSLSNDSLTPGTPKHAASSDRSNSNLARFETSELVRASSKVSKIKETNELANLKEFAAHANDNLLYTISAHKFSQFEGMLFDLMGLPEHNAFKINDCLKDVKESDMKKLEKIENASSTFLADMNVLNDNLETNFLNQYQLKKIDSAIVPKRILKTSNKSAASLISKEDETLVNSKHYKTNVLTIIHNSNARPRKALRIMINKHNGTNLDSILNEICNLFKLEYTNVRRFFSLTGEQVNLKDLI